LARAGSLVDLGTFDLVVSLAVLQHLPGRENRVRLLAELRRRLSANGKLFISTWQFLDSERQRSKILPWNTVGLRETQVDAGDYLMTWQAGGYGLRYVALIDYDELERLAHAAGLEIVHSFRSDGAEGNLNLYAVLNALKRDEPPAVVGDAGVELI
jgi:2-polyprenyl-3-methyl-5-hydroxy-6-metoxy-1,4-benzoquinol methylase